MGDIAVLEAAQDVDDRVDLANVAEELVAEPLALARAAHQTGDVDEGELRFDDLGGVRDRGEPLQPLVGHRDLADVGLDRAERIVRRLRRRGLGESVDQRRLAHVRQADDTATETHEDAPDR